MEFEVKEETNPLSKSEIRERPALKSEMLHILDEEEMYWYKRSHETWFLKGDNNTSYFHKVANGKKGSNQSIPCKKVAGSLPVMRPC
jgi:hypothetical protein